MKWISTSWCLHAMTWRDSQICAVKFKGVCLSKSSSLFEGQLLQIRRVLYGKISEALYSLNLWVQLGPARVLLNPFPILHCRVHRNKQRAEEEILTECVFLFLHCLQKIADSLKEAQNLRIQVCISIQGQNKELNEGPSTPL